MNAEKIDKIIRRIWGYHVEKLDRKVYESILKSEGIKPSAEPFSNTNNHETLEVIIHSVTITRLILELRNYFKIKSSSRSGYEELESSLHYKINEKSIHRSVAEKIPRLITAILEDET